MRLLCFYLFLQTVSALPSFGGYYGGFSVCDQWGCLNRKFNFSNVLPERGLYSDFIKSLLPTEWHMKAEQAVDKCYEFEATEKYTNTCPGQGLMHCVVDTLIESCPLDYWRQNDGCAPVASLAGNNYMFSQSRYENLQQNTPIERRTARFIERHFRSKCCDLPQLFNDTLLRECGFTEVLHYIFREPQRNTAFRNGPSIQDIPLRNPVHNVVREVFNFNMLPESTTSSSFEPSTVTEEDQDDGNQSQGALDCCVQIDDFIRPEWRDECGFKLKWDSVHRLVNWNYTGELPLNTTEQCKDLTPATSCVLNKMGMLNRWGFIDQFGMKDKIREYSNYQPSYLYDVMKGAFLFVPLYNDLCDSPRKLFNILDAMLLVCDPSKRRLTRQCNKMFADIRNSTSSKTREILDEIQNDIKQGFKYSYYDEGYYLSPRDLREQRNMYFPQTKPCATKGTVNVTKDITVKATKSYDFGILGLLGTPPSVTLIDLKPKNKTLVLLPVYQRTPKSAINDPLALNSLHDDGILRG